MGKSLNGKELGKGISQKKDGLYQGRFVNRFGKKQAVYAKTHNSKRTIPLTSRALAALKQQRILRQKILGHDSLQLTMDLYCHVTEDTLFEAMELMECAM